MLAHTIQARVEVCYGLYTTQYRHRSKKCESPSTHKCIKEGKPLIPIESAPQLATTDRRLWALAWPLMLTNLTVPLLGLVDTAVLGHLDTPEYLGAVAVGANLFSILYWLSLIHI